MLKFNLVSPTLSRAFILCFSVRSAPILLSENRLSKAQSTEQTELRQRTAISVFERSFCTDCERIGSPGLTETKQGLLD